MKPRAPSCVLARHARGLGGAGERRVRVRRLVESARAGRATVAADVQGPGVIAGFREVAHPGAARQVEIEGHRGGKRRAMHEQHDLPRAELLLACRVQVAQVQLDARVVRGNHEVLRHDRRRRGDDARGAQRRDGQVASHASHEQPST
jgi:hypothetical protein